VLSCSPVLWQWSVVSIWQSRLRPAHILHGVRSEMASIRLQPLPYSISWTLTNGLARNGDLNSFTRHPVWQRRTIAGRSACYSTAWVIAQRTHSHPQIFPVQIGVGMQWWLPSSMPFSKYIRMWFSNARGSTSATKKKASLQSNSSPISTVWRTTVPTVTWRTILSKITLFLKFATNCYQNGCN